MNRPWLWLNLLSLDAPLVAILWQACFARTLHVDVRWPAYAALGISVWLIYVIDRILDAFGNGGSIRTSRHAFYREHWWVVIRLAIAAVILLAIACSFLSPPVLHNGVITISLVAIYFAGVHIAPSSIRRYWPKELAVGVLFCTGTCLATWTNLGAGRHALLAPALIFAALCWLNCVAIEFWERAELPQWTLWIGQRLFQVALGIAVLSLALLTISAARPLFFAEIVSAIGLMWLHRQSAKFSSDALRVLADAVLLSPLLLLEFPR